MSMLTNPRPTRRGFSLVEVLISTGVVAIGLFGVMALLPLAHHQTLVGSQHDRANVAGRQAYQLAHIQELDNPFRWVWGPEPTNPPVTGGPGSRVVDNATLMSVLYDARAPRTAFCIDPLYLARHNARTTKNPNHNYFPYDAAGSGFPRMPRISVNLGNGALGVSHASELCQMPDDVLFEIPADPLLPPQQVDARSDPATKTTYYWNGSTNGLYKRATSGRFSWMLTMQPEIGEGTDLYTQSAVVFYNRNFNLDEEELAFTVQLDSISAGGGEITLTTRAGHTQESLELRPGSWLMLGAAVRVQTPYALDNSARVDHTYFRWYRVVNAAGDAVPVAGGFSREFTIVGPDWNTNVLNQPQVAIVCPSVVAVFEKSARLQTTSFWLPNSLE